VNNLEQCHIQLFNNKKKTHTPTTPWRSQPSVRPCLRPPRCNMPLHDALLCLSIVLATKTYTCRSLDMGNSATIVLPICNIYFNICNNIYFCRFHVLSRTLTIMQYSDFHIIWTNSAHYLLRNLWDLQSLRTIVLIFSNSWVFYICVDVKVLEDGLKKNETYWVLVN